MKKPIIKLLAMALAVITLVGMVPVYAFAASVDYDTTRADDYYKLISKKDWELAPGITESEIVLNNASSTHRQVAHVVEVDLNNPYTKVIPSTYKMAEGLKNKEYKVQIMSEQAAYAEANGYGNVVAAMNIALSWYDNAYYVEHPELVGEPLGYLVLDGELYMNSRGQTSGAQTCLVINFDEKDGVARPADMPKVQIRSTKDAITGWEEQVIPANFGFLVKDGKNQYSKNHTSDAASRSFMGIKEDGTFVMVMNDGRQAPFSTGFNSYEMAEFMLSLGCVYAVNGDGGGSSAFLSQRPGEELKVNCRPSDGAERETTHGILVISTAPATGEFEQAHVTTEEDYFTPGSSVQFSAVGTDLVGTPADIPADATWQLSDASFGTIADGLFVSNGKLGDVAAQMVVDGEVVGEHTVHIVMPDAIAFAQANMVVPYGKTVDLGLSATYDHKNVVLKASDVTFTLSAPAIGSISGFDFTAAEEGSATTESLLTATVGDVSATTNLSLGKGSEIVYDFEDQDLTGWSIYTNYGNYGPKGPNGKVTDANGNYWYHGQNERGYISVVDNTTGQVRNGNYALAVECDFTQVFETGYQALNLKFPVIDCLDTVAIGFWLYVPYDARHAQLGIGAGGFDNGELYNLNEGWHYVTAQAKDNLFYYINISVDDRACSSTGSYYDYVTEPNLNGKYTFYIDDITLDYSTAVDDREIPVFKTPVVVDPKGENITAMAGQTIYYSNGSFEVSVEDDPNGFNVTGLNAASAKAYVDGLEVECAYANGKITVNGLALSDGYHTVKFVIADNAGNEAWTSGSVVVSADIGASIKVAPHDPSVYRPLIGSLYWMDVVASNVETVDKVEMVFDLNNGSSWELEGLTVADGFAVTYTVQTADNVATIVIERTGAVAATGEAVIASFPVRTWVGQHTTYEGYEFATPAWLVNYGCIWKTSIELALEKGIVTFVDETVDTFGMEDLVVDTEIFFTNYTRKSVAGAQAWKDAKIAANVGWHEHTPEAVADLAPTCTKDGYTGRTYCAVCDSVVDWGTKIPATGHTYTVVDDHLVCDCGDEYTGSGLIVVNGTTYYTINGELRHSWIELEDGWYYFNPRTYAGPNGKHTTLDGITFVFENGRLTTGVWEQVSAGMRYWYGPAFYRDQTNDATSSRPYVIDGKTYLFNRAGIMQTGIVNSFVANSTLYYDCGTDGVATLLSGVYRDQLYIDGVRQVRYRLVELDGNIYFINDGDKLLKDSRVYLSDTYVAGKTFPDGRTIQPGYYTFDAEGKMVIEPAKNGVVGDFLYIDDVKQTRYKLVEFEGDFYFINDGDKIVKNQKLYLSATYVNGKTLPDGRVMQPGYYTFDAEGKMIIEPAKNGVVGDYLYINDVKQVRYQLIEYDGNFYFVNDGDKVVKNQKLYLSAAYVSGKYLPDGRAIQVGYHEFDAEGKMIVEAPKNGVVGDFLYIDDIKQTRYKLVEFEGDFYFINDGDKVVKNQKLYLSATYVNGKTLPDGRVMQPGYYTFDAEGKMIIEPAKNGVVDGYLYIDDVKQTRYKLVEFEGDYYFINDGDKIAKNTRLYLSATYVNGTDLSVGYYNFDAEGKLILN